MKSGLSNFSDAMNNFDSMSNDELRVRLLESGFQNLPVTATTRSVLIKKLKKHFDGIKEKERRETIHVVTKYSSGEESESDIKKSSRRKTYDFPVNKLQTGRVALKKLESNVEIQEESDDDIILPTESFVSKPISVFEPSKSKIKPIPKPIEEDENEPFIKQHFSKLPEKTNRSVYDYREPQNSNTSELSIKKRLSYLSHINDYGNDNKSMGSSFSNFPSKKNEYDSIKNSIESEHLKQFSKRLSQLRAEPLNSQSSYRHDSYSRPPIRQKVAKDEDNTFLHHFKTLWVSLNEEYSINFYILMLFAVLFTILLIVIFI